MLLTILGFLKPHYKLVGLFILGALTALLLAYLFFYRPNAGADRQVTRKELKKAIKNVEQLQKQIDKQLLTNDSLKTVLANDTVGQHKLKQQVIYLKEKAATQSSNIKKIKSSYEKVDALDNATDDELFRHLSSIKINDGTGSDKRR